MGVHDVAGGVFECVGAIAFEQAAEISVRDHAGQMAIFEDRGHAELLARHLVDDLRHRRRACDLRQCVSAVHQFADAGEPPADVPSGMQIGEMIARKGIRKQYYLETRGDILLRNKEVFKFWRDIGLEYMFLGIEAIDEEGLKQFRKRVSLSKNFEALEFARSLGVSVAINLIADPSWDRERFRLIREWCMEIPEIVNISVNTPYPGTES